MRAVLAFDTAAADGSVAAGAPGRPESEISVPEREQAAALLPLALEALRLAGIEREEIDAVVVADGPGSFTGLRIGVATAKGILRTLPGATLHTAPALLAAACAARAPSGVPIAALFDALRGEVFAAIYEFGPNGVHTHLSPMCGPIPAVRAVAPVTPILAVGNGARAHADELRAWLGADALPADPASATGAGALIELLQVPEGVALVPDPDAFEPTYGRRAAAQDRWEEAHGRALPHS